MKNKWILVTGASGGIGFGISTELIKQGYNIIVHGRSLEKLKEIYSNFDQSKINYKALDLTHSENIKNMFLDLKSEIGLIYGLVHCAGYQVMSGISLAKIENIRKMFEINTFSAFELIKYISKKKFGVDKGSIILISSLAAHEGAVGNAFYASTKGALEGFLIPACAELRNKRRINIIIPGVVKSGMGETLYSHLTEEQQNKLEEGYPLGLGSTEDIANMVEYLLSEKSKWITGQKFVLDGGHLAVLN